MIRLQDISFSYGQKTILSHLNLQIPLSGLTAFTGPSGCGKTTLLRILAGLSSPQSGQIEGIVPSETAFLFQENRLLPWRTAAQHIADVLPKEHCDETAAWLSFVELDQEHNLYPHSLSGGMARRLALARCAALGGTLLLLDEPFTGVDLDCVSRIMNRLKAIKTPIILISHEPAVLAECDRVYTFDGPPLTHIS